MAWTHLPHSSAQENDNKKYKRKKLQGLFSKVVISEIIFRKVYGMEKKKKQITNPCVDVPSSYLVSKMLILLSLTLCQCYSILGTDTEGASELQVWFCFSLIYS